MRDTFSEYHPLVNFFYFALVLLCAMCLMNPISLGISLLCGLCYRHRLDGIMGMRYMIPMALLAGLCNPLFNHRGSTILTYFPSGNPLTLESILYGIAAATMLLAVVCWFSCYSQVMTTDKFIYLFGAIIPTLSLTLSMTLRFIPRFREQLQIVREGQYNLGHRDTKKSTIAAMGQSGKIISIMTTWALENAIETADSMKSRGYGLPNRSAFSIYRWSERDSVLLSWLIFCAFYLGCGYGVGGLGVQYFPSVKLISLSSATVSFQFVYMLLCLTPVILQEKEKFRWKNSLKTKKTI